MALPPEPRTLHTLRTLRTPASSRGRAAALAAVVTAFAVALLSAVPVQGGSAEAPEVTDTEGDAGLPPLDIAAVWFDANETTLRVHLARGADSGQVPPGVACVEGNCTGAGASLLVVFGVLKADGTPAPAASGYNASYVLVRVGPDDPRVQAVAGTLDAEGAATPVEAVAATFDATVIQVDVPLASAAIGLGGGAAGARVSAPYAASYAMACLPVAGCENEGAPAEQASSLWDRAPDSGAGSDFLFPAPPAPPAAGSTTTSAQPAGPAGEEEQPESSTETSTEAASPATVTETVTITTAAKTEAKASPAAGILVAFAVVALAAVVRRRLS